MPSRRAEALVVLSLAVVAATVLTYPLAFQLSQIGRVETPDGRWSIWVIAWVARTLVEDPLHVFDANIFYPHRNALFFSELNLGGGMLGAPVYWLTKNPYATHNFVFLAGFVLSAVGMYYLCRRLTGSRGAAAVAAVTFAFCPYVFGRTPHIQLLLTAGFPFSMLALHRLIDRPTIGRAVALAAALLLTAITCGYYGVFVALLVGFGVLFFASTRGLWSNAWFWTTVAGAGILSASIGAALLLPYLRLSEEAGFGRGLQEAQLYAADWRSYLTSNAWAHRWMLPLLKRWKDVLFPGFLATGLGLAGMALTFRRQSPWPRDLLAFYMAVTLVAFWASFGPSAGLYELLYAVVPMFSFMRAPARFAAVVIFGLSVLTSFAVASLIRGRRHAGLMAAGLAVVAAAELAIIPMSWRAVPPLPAAHRLLATLPRAPVLELPYFYDRPDLVRHTYYMLYSTFHWHPLINGYSDHIPADFRDTLILNSTFPTKAAFKHLEPIGLRYVIFHMNLYDHRNRARTEDRLQEFAPYLRLLLREGDVRLYEIVGWPE